VASVSLDGIRDLVKGGMKNSRNSFSEADVLTRRTPKDILSNKGGSENGCNDVAWMVGSVWSRSSLLYSRFREEVER